MFLLRDAVGLPTLPFRHMAQSGEQTQGLGWCQERLDTLQRERVMAFCMKFR